MAGLSLHHNPKTPQGKHRLNRMIEKARRRGDLKGQPAERCRLDQRYPCDPTRCPPIREKLANIKTTGERRKCRTQ